MMVSNPLGGMIKPLDFGFGPTGKKSCPKTIKDGLRNIYWKGKHEGPCFCCGKKIDRDSAHVGRIQAGVCGGKYTLPNSRLLCKTCNLGMSKTNMKVYMRRNFPERYKKYFPKSKSQSTKKGPRKQKNQGMYGLPTFRTPKLQW